MKYNFDKYGNVIDEVLDEDQEEFDWFYLLDENDDETPRWIENMRVEKTSWWSDTTFETESETIFNYDTEEYYVNGIPVYV